MTFSTRDESVGRVLRLIIRLNRARRKRDHALVRELDQELSEYDDRRGWARTRTACYGERVPHDDDFETEEK